VRLLLLMQGRTIADHPGYDDGCRRLRNEGSLSEYRVLAYSGLAERLGWEGVWQETITAAREMAAEVVFLQYFHGPTPDPSAMIAALRRLPSRPVIAVSSGDPFGRLLDRPPQTFRTAASLADATFLTETGGLARDLARTGARTALMPHGFCQARFDPPAAMRPVQAEFDVVFIGNLHRVRNPARRMFWSALQRRRQVAALQARYGRRLALFGSGWEGWPSARGPLPYDEQFSACRRARVVVGPYPNGGMDYYMSDRPMITIRAGAPYVEPRVPRVDRIFQDRRHWFLYREPSELLALCDRLLEWSDEERYAFGSAAAADIAARHSQYHRLRAMLATLADMRTALMAGQRPPPPRLDFFLPGVDPQAEMAFATAGWV